MRFVSPLIACSLLFSVTPLFATSQIYRYTDDAGTQTFTNDLQSIPEPYRRLAVPLYSEMTSQAGSTVPVPTQGPQEPTAHVVTVSSDYRMGAYDTHAAAVRMAIQSAKRQALEQAATYLESVTEIKNLDVTRDDLRAYSAGSVIVLDQQTSTRTDNGAVVIHVDLTAQVDRKEAIQAITALRDNDSAKQELASLRIETDRLRRQLDAANQALATARSQEQIEALLAERQQLLDQLHASSMVAESRTTGIYAGQTIPAMIGGLIFQPTVPPTQILGVDQGPRAGSPSSPQPSDFPSAAAQNRLKEAITLPTQPLIPAFPQIQPLGVPHGSLTQTPSTITVPSAKPAFPQIQPLGVPHGSLTQIPSTGRFFSGPIGGQGR
jgi:hypothetical protein